MSPDLWSLYALMLKSRLFEEAVKRLWEDGLISGEMHLGTGEEAIVAAVVSQMIDGDALALDHRGTPPLIIHGVDPISILLELLGQPNGLCGGMGGHMHLFSKGYLAASSSIVGSSGPAGVGFALAAQYLRPGTISVAFFGEGSMNQGMMMEAMNLAAAWNLPVLFVCKDDQWVITTSTNSGNKTILNDRTDSLGLKTFQADGRDVLQIWEPAAQAIEYARSGQGLAFLHANCVHLEGHFLGYQMIRVTRNPLKEMPPIALPSTRSFLQPRGAKLNERLEGLKKMLSAVLDTLRDPRNDPIKLTRSQLRSEPQTLKKLEAAIHSEIEAILDAVLGRCSCEKDELHPGGGRCPGPGHARGFPHHRVWRRYFLIAA